MKIRKGFVTNSSSTNFLIISKEEITLDYLFDKMTNGQPSAFDEEIKELCRLMMITLEKQDDIDIEQMKEKYGIQVESVFHSFEKNKCFVYTGKTDNSDSELSSFFTHYPCEYNVNGFYLNKMDCLY